MRFVPIRKKNLPSGNSKEQRLVKRKRISATSPESRLVVNDLSSANGGRRVLKHPHSRPQPAPEFNVRSTRISDDKWACQKLSGPSMSALAISHQSSRVTSENGVCQDESATRPSTSALACMHSPRKTPTASRTDLTYRKARSRSVACSSQMQPNRRITLPDLSVLDENPAGPVIENLMRAAGRLRRTPA